MELKFKDLLAAVSADATLRDVVVTLIPSPSHQNTTMRVIYSDELGTINYLIPDVDLLVKEVEAEIADGTPDPADAFWCVLNSSYKN